MLDNKSSFKAMFEYEGTREAVSCEVSEQQLESTASINCWWGRGWPWYTYIYTKRYILDSERIECEPSDMNRYRNTAESLVPWRVTGQWLRLVLPTVSTYWSTITLHIAVKNILSDHIYLNYQIENLAYFNTLINGPLFTRKVTQYIILY